MCRRRRIIIIARFSCVLHVVSDAPNVFVHDISVLRDFVTDTRRDYAIVQVPIPKVLLPAPPPSNYVPLGTGALDAMWEKAVERERKSVNFNSIAKRVVANTNNNNDENLEKKTSEFQKFLQVSAKERDRVQRIQVINRAIAAARQLL